MKKRVTAGVMAAMLMLVNVVVPVQPVFASHHKDGDASPEVTTSNGTDQPVWCQLTGQGWKSLLGDESSGSSSQRYELNELPDGHSEEVYIGTDGQVYAPDRSDRALKQELSEYCAQQYTLEIPAQPGVKCDGPLTVWDVPASTDVLSWGLVSIEGQDHLVVQIIADGYVFTNGEYSNDYGVAPDSGECVPTDTEIQVPATPKVTDPCGLANATWIVPADTDQVTWTLLGSGPTAELVATTRAGYVFPGDTTTHNNYGMAKDQDSDLLCATPENPTWNDPCGRVNDTYTIPETEGVDYYVNGKLVEDGTYPRTGANVKVTAEAQVGYELTSALEESHKFTNERCEPEVNLEAKAWCDVLDTKIKAVVTNTTNSTQRYEIVVENANGDEIYNKVVRLKKGESEKVYVKAMGDGEFTVNVYAMKGNKRGELLASKTVEKECVDDFTPQIFKKNQDGAILSTGTFDVEVCQEYGEFARLYMDGKDDNCTTYEDVMFGTDGSWFANNVEYKHNVPTTVTITETEAPVGCTLSTTPWVFTWSYNDVQLMSRYMMTGSWNTEDGTNVFNLYNDCDQPGRGEYTPTPSTPSTPVETLAETGDSENAIIGVAVGMLLASIGFAISPRFRRGEA